MQLETHIGRYHVQSVVGVGGFGTVVRGRDDELGATVAIKILAEHWAGDVEVRERFLAEARHLRRVRNPHVVSVFDLGELPDGRPWFVMEYADRGSLELRLEGRATGASVDAPSLRRVVTSMADAVGALHAAGVIHRDINPRNVLISSDRAAAGDRDMAAARAAGTTMRRGLLGDDERLLVSDLGLAKDLRLSGNAASLIGGSPHYQAPEQRQQHASIRASADVYALTGVLWHLVLGEVPPDPHAVRDELGEVDARWRDVFATGLATDPDERYATVFEWRDSVLAVLTDGAEMSSPLARPRLPSGTVSDHCPYRGLAAFQPEHAADFFGREVLLGELVERLRYDRTLAVAGPSGSGKSSLVRAGLIPALAGGALTGSAEWPIALMTPGSDPVGELSYQLLRLASRCDGFTPPSLEGRPERAAVRVVADAITDRFGGMVVCIDQFEELFTECPTPEERAAFVDMLAGLVDPTASRCRVVLAMRADFYAQAATSPWLARRISENQVLVGPMDRPELRRAIEGPARRAGLVIEDGLVDELLDDAGHEAGSLPLVAHALVETWRRRSAGRLTLAGYRDAGGVQGAIAQTAEDLYGKLDDHEREIVRSLFLRLVNPGEGSPDTRRHLPRAEIEAAPNAAELSRLVERLVDTRLVTAGADSVVVAHEALLTNWPRLRSWIDADRDALRLRQHIGRAAAEWRDRGNDADLLYRGTPLATAVEWRTEHDDQLGAAEREFLDSSLAAEAEAHQAATRQERRTRRIRRLAVAGLAGVLLVGALGWAAVGRTRSEEREAAAEERVIDNLGLLARVTAADDPYLALALGNEARVRASDSSVETWISVVASRQELSSSRLAPLGDPLMVGRALSVTLDPAARVIAVGRDDGTVLLVDATTRAVLGEPIAAHDNGVEEIVFSADGTRLATAGLDGRAMMWDVDDLLAGVADPITVDAGGLVWSVAWSPDGEQIATASENGVVQLWDSTTGAPEGDPLVDSLDMLTVAYSPSGDRLVAGNGAGSIWAWRLPDREPIFEEVDAHGGFDVWEMVFSPDGELLTTVSSDRTAVVRDPDTGEALSTPFLDPTGEPAAGDLRGIQFSDDGAVLLGGTDRGQMLMWDLGEERLVEIGGPETDSTIVDSFARTDAGVAASVADDQMLRLWAVDRLQPLGIDLTGIAEGAYDAAFAPDGTWLAIGNGAGGVELFDAATGERHGTVDAGLAGRVWAVDAGPGPVLAAGDDAGTVVVVTTDGGRVATPPPFDGAVAAVALSPDGGRLAAAGRDDGRLLIWDVADDRSVADVDVGSGVGDLTWSHDGERLVVADLGGTVQVYDSGGELVAGPARASRDSIFATSIDHDDAVVAVATGNDDVTLWPATLDGAPVGSISELDDDATAVGFLGERHLMVVATRDGSVRIWDPTSGRAVGSNMAAHGGEIWGIAVHPDLFAFATVSTDGTARIWDLLEVSAACELTAGVVADEQPQFLGEDGRLEACDDAERG